MKQVNGEDVLGQACGTYDESDVNGIQKIGEATVSNENQISEYDQGIVKMTRFQKLKMNTQSLKKRLYGSRKNKKSNKNKNDQVQ